MTENNRADEPRVLKGTNMTLTNDTSHVHNRYLELVNLAQDWVESKRPPTGHLNTNVMTVGVTISKRLGEALPIQTSAVRTARGQVKGLSGQSISRSLLKFGERRSFTSEGGRTSRGSMELALEFSALLNEYSSENLRDISISDREYLGERLEEWFVRLIQHEYFDKKRIDADFEGGKPTHLAVGLLLEAAAARGGNAAGAVAQHLVGAKLALRFPDVSVGNEGYTTADQPTSRAGDFRIRDTVFHVTMSPGEHLMGGRCIDNIKNHFRPVVLVPESKVIAAKQLAEISGVLTDVSIIAIETFVGLNIEEMAGFRTTDIRSGLRELLEKYNERVAGAEPDPSLLIEIPTNL